MILLQSLYGTIFKIDREDFRTWMQFVLNRIMNMLILYVFGKEDG